jgi:creatinine amidohydrolase
MLAAHPERVRMDRAETFGSAHLDWRRDHPELGLGMAPLRPGWLIGDLNPKGAIGDAAAATAAKGEVLLDTAAGRLARLVGSFAHFTSG